MSLGREQVLMSSSESLEALIERPVINLTPLRTLLLQTLQDYVFRIRSTSGKLQGKYKAKRVVQHLFSIWEEPNLKAEDFLPLVLSSGQVKHLKYFSTGKAEKESATIYFEAWNTIINDKEDNIVKRLNDLSDLLVEPESKLKGILQACISHWNSCLKDLMENCNKFLTENQDHVQAFLDNEKTQAYFRYIELQSSLVSNQDTIKLLQRNLESMKLLFERVINKECPPDELVQEAELAKQFMLNLIEDYWNNHELVNVTKELDELQQLKVSWFNIEAEVKFIREHFGDSLKSVIYSSSIPQIRLTNLCDIEGAAEVIQQSNMIILDYCSQRIKINDEVEVAPQKPAAFGFCGFGGQ